MRTVDTLPTVEQLKEWAISKNYTFMSNGFFRTLETGCQVCLLTAIFAYENNIELKHGPQPISQLVMDWAYAEFGVMEANSIICGFDKNDDTREDLPDEFYDYGFSARSILKLD